jgi:hypothetical protein
MAAIRLATYVKDPDEKLDYSVDWRPDLEPRGDTIASSAWVLPGGITQSGSPAPSNDSYSATIWLEGGSVGIEYVVVNRVTTTQGRTLEASIVVAVRNSAA